MSTKPTPSDWCECGHTRERHSASGFTCFARMNSCSCDCTGFKPATPQPALVPVSEADVERVAKDIYDYCFHPPNVWPNTQNYKKFIECARYHLEQLAVVQKERDMLKERDNERIDMGIEWVKKFHQCEQERGGLKQRVAVLEKENNSALSYLIKAVKERNSLRAELATLRQDKEKLKEALKNNWNHDETCDARRFKSEHYCTCGLKEALEI